MSYKVKIRIGSAVERHTAQTLDAAVALARERLAAVPLRTTATLPFREVAPVAQVAARAEIAGGGRHGGLDVRGNGDVEAWTGRLRRRAVEPRHRESAYDALRRALAG
jgi:hypothetical protein